MHETSSLPAVRNENPLLRRRLLWLMAGRLAVATLLLGGTLLLHADDEAVGFATFTPHFLLGLIAVTYAASIVFAVWITRISHAGWLAGVQVGFDLLLTTGLIAVSGGATSIFAVLYGVVILLTALSLGPRACHAAAAVAVVLYTSLALSLATGTLPHPPDQDPARYLISTGDLRFAWLTHTVGFVLIAMLAGNLASRLHRAGGALEEAERSAADLARLTDDIVRSLTSGLLTAGLDGRLRTVNPAGAQMFRLTEDELIGAVVKQLLPIEEMPPHEALRGEGDATRPDGTKFPVGYTANALIDANGTIIGTLVSFQDLTEVAELRRTAERAKRLAALGRLSAGLAHEIRNPLSSISGSVELVRESSKLEEEDRRLLRIVSAEVERLDDLVSTMLMLGRPREPNRSDIDLSVLISDVVEMARRSPSFGDDVVLMWSPPIDPVRAYVDSDQVRQVLWNLLKNAAQVSPHGGSVHVFAKTNGDGSAVVQVQDEGHGVNDAERERLFDMFYSGRPHGVGLGLSLVKQIMDAHGGAVNVRSESGRGAMFEIRFGPTTKVSANGPESPAASPPDPMRASSSRQ